jgi:hypothetical protein
MAFSSMKNFMNKDSDITRFASLPSSARRASSALSIGGNIGFWLQIVLGAVAAIILLFSTAILSGGESTSNNSGSAFALFCATAGVLTLAVSIFFFYRYKVIARLIQASDRAQRPKKLYTLKLVKFGLIANLTGMLISIIGAEAFAGLLYAKASKIPLGAAVYSTSRLIEPVEITVLLANIHTIFSHFAGIAIGLWLLDRLNK